ncbi:hypothetical protein ABK040_013893 [Willaertia magna]
MSSAGHLVFVYGTLKEGFANYEHKMMKYKSCKLISKQAITLDKFPLMVLGERKIPYLFGVKGIGNNIEGEVYLVDDEHLKELDIFEGCDTGHYSREIINVRVEDNSEEISCNVYVRVPQKGDEELLSNNHLMQTSFTLEQNKNYARLTDDIG